MTKLASWQLSISVHVCVIWQKRYNWNETWDVFINEWIYIWKLSKCILFVLCYLTHWGRDKMAAIFQTTFSNAFSRMKMFKFRLRFHWSLFPRVQLTIFQHWFRWWLGADQATSHYLNQGRKVYWRIYASLGLNELNYSSINYWKNWYLFRCIQLNGVKIIHWERQCLLCCLNSSHINSGSDSWLQLHDKKQSIWQLFCSSDCLPASGFFYLGR